MAEAGTPGSHCRVEPEGRRRVGRESRANPAVEKASWLLRPPSSLRVSWGPGTSVSRTLYPWPCSTNAASHLLSSYTEHWQMCAPYHGNQLSQYLESRSPQNWGP